VRAHLTTDVLGVNSNPQPFECEFDSLKRDSGIKNDQF